MKTINYDIWELYTYIHYTCRNKIKNEDMCWNFIIFQRRKWLVKVMRKSWSLRTEEGLRLWACNFHAFRIILAYFFYSINEVKESHFYGPWVFRSFLCCSIYNQPFSSLPSYKYRIAKSSVHVYKHFNHSTPIAA